MKLSDTIRSLPLVGPVYIHRLDKLGIETISDLLHHVPHRYKDFRIVSNITRVQIGEVITVKGKVISMKNIYTRNGKKIQEAFLEDTTGQMQIIWFNQRYLTNTIKAGEWYSFSGKCDWFDRKKTLISPEYENIQNGSPTIHTGCLVPVYPETFGVSSKWIRGRIFYVLKAYASDFVEFLPSDTLVNLSLMRFPKAIKSVHFPSELTEAEEAKKRLAFDELLFHQLKSLFRKSEWGKHKVSHTLQVGSELNEFITSLPFELTSSQTRSIKEISSDLTKNSPMNRLLEGDVGSGKTVVAAAGAFATFVNGYQTIVMAPTQILAQQHFDTLGKIFAKYKVRVSLVTSAGVKKDVGKTDIFVGTHALIHKKVKFDNVALVVIDEQHRFGVEQRAHLVKKTSKGVKAPHILTMTATPIPRTVALTIYGDLDLSTLDELPKGRKPIITWLVPQKKREGAYLWIKEQIQKSGIQAFIICPLIEESEVETMKQVKAATAEFDKLKEIFSGLILGLLHGRQSAKVKNEVLDAFKKGDIDILVSTPVVEVGIDVPNATIMVIEAGERFGLAQLHQLRGRIGRGEKKPYCLIFTDSRSRTVKTRLSALTKTTSGFELAELDLRLRGPGEIFGLKQHGFPELKIASWTDTELIKSARKVAQEAIDNTQKFSKLIDKLQINDIIPN